MSLEDFSTLRSRRKWLRPMPVAGVIGGAIVLATWGRVMVTPGEVLQRDLSYPLYSEDLFGDFYPLLAPDGLTSIGHLSLMPIFAPAFGLARLSGVSAGALMRALLVAQPLIAFLAAFAAFAALTARTRLDGRARAAGATLAGLFYALNPWAVARVEHLGLLFGYALLPAALALAVESERRRSTRLAAVAGLVLAGVAVSAHVLMFAGLILVVLLSWRLLTAPRGTDRRAIWVRAGVTTAVVAGLHAFAWLPVLHSAVLAGALPAELGASETDFVIRSGERAWTNAVLMTANPQWHERMGAVGAASLGWSALGLIAPLALVATVWDRRLRGVSMVCLALAAATVGFVIWSESAAARPVLEGIISRVPVGRGLREPDKATGLLALALAWGVGAAFALALTSLLAGKLGMRAVLGGAIAGLTLVTLFAYGWPSVRTFLWSSEGATWEPTEIPPGYRQVLDVVRSDAEPGSRILVFEEGERVPSWDRGRVLRRTVTRSVDGPAVVSSRTAIASKSLALMELLPPDELGRAIVGVGATRIVVVRDTKAGTELDARVAAAPGLRRAAASDVLAYYLTDGSAAVGTAAGAWTPVTGINGLTGGLRALVAVDAVPGRCAGSLDLPTELDESTDLHALRFDCLAGEHFVSLRPASAAPSDWQYADGSPAGFRRWLAALRSEGLRVRDLDYGLGMIWRRSAAEDVEVLPLEVPIGRAGPGPYDVYLRVLVGDGATPVSVELIRPRAARTMATTIMASGELHLRWFRIASGVTELLPDARLEISGGPGFSALNAAAVVPASVDASLRPAAGRSAPPAPQVELERRSRTWLEGRVVGAAAPFLLVVNQTYDPGWRAAYPSGEAAPIPINGGQMAFRLDQVGDFGVRVTFVPQVTHNLGLAIAGVALVVLLGYLGWPFNRRARQTTEVP